MNNNTECANYFKSQKAYQRCMKELRKKWKSYGKVAGRVTLKDTTVEERRAIGGIIGKVFYDKQICFSFAEFEQGLQRTRFAPVDIQEVLEAYFGEKLSTNQGQKEEQQRKKMEFLDSIRAYFGESAGSESMAFLWMQDMIFHKKYGYQLLVREYGKDPKDAKRLAKNVGNALLQLEGVKETGNERPLAVLAADISGNPHYFDRSTTPGQLLMHAICYWKKEELPESAHQWRELLFDAGIVPDNVSSMVHAYGLHLQTKAGWHPAYDAFCRLGEPFVITMENLKGITGARAEGDRVYVVENEMVFSYLLERAGKGTKELSGGKPPELAGMIKSSQDEKLTMLCTSGQLRAVALELIPFILDSGVDIYYSGDIDPDGIGIADRLWQKFGERIHIWRMSPADYEISISKERIGNNGLAKLGNVTNPLLMETAERVKATGLAAYQENLLEELLEDIR